jgi:hypothetical protein
MVWLLAFVVPIMLLLVPSVADPRGLVLTLAAAFAMSCVLGYLDKRSGRFSAYRLKVLVPIGLFTASLVIAGIWRIAVTSHA